VADDRLAAALAEIREREQQATPGPWGWRGNIDNGDPYLTSLGHRDEAKPDGTVVRHHAGDVLGHIPVELTRADAINRGVGDPEFLPEPKVDVDPIDTYDKRYDAAIEAAREAEIEDYLTDDYGQPRTKDRLAFCTNWLYTDARKLVTFQVAPNVTERSDPRVYRADITGIRHPDAEFIEHSRQDLSRLLALAEAVASLCRDTDGNWLDPTSELPVGEFQAAISGALLPEAHRVAVRRMNLNDAVEELSHDALAKWGDSQYREGIGHGHQDVYEARRLAEDAERKAEGNDRGE
jgi:hypothetical protein